MNGIEITPLGLGFLALFAAGIGFLLGGAVKAMGKPAPRPPAEPLPPPDHKPDPDALLEDVLHARYDQRTRNLVVEVQGQRYLANSEMSDKHRKRMEQALQALTRWLSAPAPAKAPAQAPAQPAASAQAIAPPPDAAVKPVSTNIMDAAAYVLNKPKAAPVAYKSIAAQINDVLQEQIAGTEIARRGLHLAETPDQGVLVFVGEESFPGVEAVPYEDVRQVLKAAAAEWERRNRKV